YRGDGAYGQFCVVVPGADLVVATTAAAPDMPAVLDAVWAHLLPALADGPLPPSGADDALAGRFATLGLPPVPADGPDAVPAGTVLRLAGTAGLRGVTGAGLRRGATGWTLTLDAWDGTVVADVGTGAWAVTEPDDGGAPLAVSAGSAAPGRLRADVLLLETPHRLRLDGDVAAGTLTATWATDPLGGVSLRSMAPR
ncbi:MAG: serine hydrolase, partial [Actinobacteria bacterium]|nr:serine hydrolase [Actinomycetota bacterium]